MPLNTHELIQVATELSKIHNLRITTRHCVRGGVIAGVSTVLGGMILGPLGLAIGGSLGGLTATLTSSNFNSVPDVIMNDLTPAQREMLIMRLKNALQDIRPEDAAMLLAFVMSNQPVQMIVMQAIREFFTNDMHVSLTS